MINSLARTQSRANTLEHVQSQSGSQTRTHTREGEGGRAALPLAPPTMSQSQSQSGGASHRQTSLAVAVCSLHSCRLWLPPPLLFLLPFPPFAPPPLHCPVSLAAPFYHCVRLRGLFARVNIKFEPQPNEPSRVEPPTTAAASAAATFFWPWAWQGG